MAERQSLTRHEWTALGQPYEFIDAAPLCAALAKAYPGLKFSVHVAVQSDQELERFGDRDDLVEVRFTVRGTADDLVRHRFADPEWLEGLRPRGTRRGWYTEGLGRADRISCTAPGVYRVTGAQYEDGMDRIAALFAPAMLEECQQKRQP